eukprot:449634-Rhodomonas_salina.1
MMWVWFRTMTPTKSILQWAQWRLVRLTDAQTARPTGVFFYASSLGRTVRVISEGELSNSRWRHVAIVVESSQ